MASPFLDAVLLIVRFNKRTNFMRAVPDIEPQEVFGSIGRPEYEAATQRAGALLFTTASVGASFHNCPGSKPLEVEVVVMKQKHPGFGQKSYDLVVWGHAVAMR